MSIADLRRDYKARALGEADAPADPFVLYRLWLDEAVRAEMLDATAMTLATASPEAEPAARIVLLKDVTASGFIFFTNYESAKGAHLEANPRAALVSFWADLERQVRVIARIGHGPCAREPRRLMRDHAHAMGAEMHDVLMRRRPEHLVGRGIDVAAQSGTELRRAIKPSPARA